MHHLPKKFPRTVLASVVALLGAGARPAVAAADPPHHAGYVYAAGGNELVLLGDYRAVELDLPELVGAPPGKVA